MLLGLKNKLGRLICFLWLLWQKYFNTCQNPKRLKQVRDLVLASLHSYSTPLQDLKKLIGHLFSVIFVSEFFLPSNRTCCWIVASRNVWAVHTRSPECLKIIDSIKKKSSNTFFYSTTFAVIGPSVSFGGEFAKWTFLSANILKCVFRLFIIAFQGSFLL